MGGCGNYFVEYESRVGFSYLFWDEASLMRNWVGWVVWVDLLVNCGEVRYVGGMTRNTDRTE